MSRLYFYFRFRPLLTLFVMAALVFIFAYGAATLQKNRFGHANPIDGAAAGLDNLNKIHEDLPAPEISSSLSGHAEEASNSVKEDIIAVSDEIFNNH